LGASGTPATKASASFSISRESSFRTLTSVTPRSHHRRRRCLVFQSTFDFPSDA
jgi:hypothetical protein